MVEKVPTMGVVMLEAVGVFGLSASTITILCIVGVMVYVVGCLAGSLVGPVPGVLLLTVALGIGLVVLATFVTAEKQLGTAALYGAAA